MRLLLRDLDQARATFRRDCRAVAAIEFAIMVPVMLLMAIAGIDLGMGFYRKMQVENAAQAGAQWAIRNGFDTTSISNAVTAATSASVTVSPPPVQFCGCATSSGLTTTSCGTPCPGGTSPGTYTTVSAQMTYQTLINYAVLPTSFNLVSQSTVRLQ